jgi:hypothetical protein
LRDELEQFKPPREFMTPLPLFLRLLAIALLVFGALVALCLALVAWFLAAMPDGPQMQVDAEPNTTPAPLRRATKPRMRSF